MLHELLGRLATEFGHDFKPGAPFGDSLDPCADPPVLGEGAAGPSSGEINAQGFNDVDGRSTKFPECGPKFAGECSGGGDDGCFRGNEARLKLVLNLVLERIVMASLVPEVKHWRSST